MRLFLHYVYPLQSMSRARAPHQFQQIQPHDFNKNIVPSALPGIHIELRYTRPESHASPSKLLFSFSRMGSSTSPNVSRSSFACSSAADYWMPAQVVKVEVSTSLTFGFSLNIVLRRILCCEALPRSLREHAVPGANSLENILGDHTKIQLALGDRKEI